MIDLASHWATTWADRDPSETSWFQETPEPCSSEVRALAPPGARIAAVGVGASHLIADLLDRGYGPLEAIDISSTALERLRGSLGAAAARVIIRCEDVRSIRFDHPVDLWHDRATFHFLVDPDHQRAYVESCALAVRPGGHAVLATFALDGPSECSGLPIVRYSGDTLAAAFQEDFRLVRSYPHDHRTPWGSVQRFTYAVLQRLGAPDIA
ncbi:MAG: class I SAM-dependent methyltransferase [Acidimicrobiales bacterium]